MAKFKAINFIIYYRIRISQISITSERGKYLKVLIVRQICIKTVLFRIILQCILDKSCNYHVRLEVIQPNGSECFN